VRIHARKNGQGNRRQVVNNAGLGKQRVADRVEVRDRRLPQDYTALAKQERHCYVMACPDDDEEVFELVRLTDNEVRGYLDRGCELWHGTLSREGTPKGRKVV